ncbi:RluA family pseudouridine synthase [Fictibacillus aquaticus]|uniref:Pseudouridine synthase n=1 Tax=Fictibacillus aquaticus TaxID=2021314 RepID=A0A235FCU2_9BACL|nr:RluA family pseudouridine synthase [Fictibacillus aquaticus]OYD59052.1 RNA pseudouridine synthase [Fictibacillus aquaticus]
MKKNFTISWTVGANDGPVLLREFLKKKRISKAALTDIKFNGGALYVNGKEESVRKQLAASDIVTVIFPPETVSTHMEGIPMALDILFEDEHFLAVNKPPGIPTIPSRYQQNGSLAQGVLHYYECNGIEATFHAVNRLDRDTSGVVLIAKHRFAHSLLSQQQTAGNYHRKYAAIAEGEIVSPLTIDAPIGRNTDSIIERKVCEDGQHAVTHVTPLKKLSAIEGTLIKLNLETGRTHQIRVHLSYIGHPLAGDDLYGGSKDYMKRQALHSSEAAFYHPFLEKEIIVKAELPEDMMKWID